ncbi:MAG: SufE family protein [Muribaculaceae bacterium]|jgi:cysteine desulfuration protein SufE|nr:SufE family protein [Muribaculaceae bacterium]
MNDINDIQDQIIAEFEDFTDWLDRYSLIIEMGNALPPLDEKYKTESNLIDGCQSRVWLHSELDDEGRLHFTADSDAIIVKGIIAMLLRVLSDRQPQEILDADLYFIERIGLQANLSPTRSNGLLAMVKRIRATALAASASDTFRAEHTATH